MSFARWSLDPLRRCKPPHCLPTLLQCALQHQRPIHLFLQYKPPVANISRRDMSTTTISAGPLATQSDAEPSFGISTSAGPSSSSSIAGIHDPFLASRGFSYEPGSSIRAHYPLSAKSVVPGHIQKPDYAKENVRDWLAFWWQVRGG